MTLVAAQHFDKLLSDDQMLAQLRLGEAFVIKRGQWQLIERQIERLGFGEFYFVTQVNAGHGESTKVTPVQGALTRRAA